MDINVSTAGNDLTMAGCKQLEREIIIYAPVSEVWAVIADNTLLPKWVPAVDDVTCDVSHEGVGTVRSCGVTMAGRSGTMVERCVEFVPETRASYVVDEDTFGFGKMFADYGFTLNFEPLNKDQTQITIESFYTPRNVLFTAMNVVMMRRKFQDVVDDLLMGLKTYVEGAVE